MAPGCTLGGKQTGKDSVMLWVMFCEKNPGLWHFCGCYFDTVHLSKFVADQEFPNGSGLFQQEKERCCAVKNFLGMVWGTWQKVQGVDLVSKFLWSHCVWASVKCAGLSSQIDECPTLQLTGLKGSTTNILVPDIPQHTFGELVEYVVWWLIKSF